MEEEYVFDLREPIFANSVAFNGEIITELSNVGGGYTAFEILAGPNREEFPLILVKGKFEEISKSLKLNDKIAGLGFLKKIQGQFVIESTHINRLPTKEEIEKLS